MLYNPYSVSKIGAFNQCPMKFKLNYIDKVKIDWVPQLALERGSYMHTVLENNFDYSTPWKLSEVFTEEHRLETIEILKKFRASNIGQEIQDLINHPSSKLELDFSFNSKLEIVDYWDKSSWFRGSADLYNTDLSTPLIIDYKSGKDKSNDPDFGTDQGMLYAVYLFIRYPELNKVLAKFVFLEHSTYKDIYFYRTDFNKYIKQIYNRTKKVEDTKVFKPEVSALCDYCDYKDIYCTAKKDLEEKTLEMLKPQGDFDF
jgi:hypothetical protein